MTNSAKTKVTNWTLITGASSGLGTDFARMAAADGRSLILVARSLDKLAALASELKLKHGVAIEVKKCDLTDAAQTTALITELTPLPIDCVINNAGVGLLGPFAEMDASGIENMLLLNIVSLTRLTRALLPSMITDKRGQIMNVASTAAFQPGPLMAVYYASKAYVLSFSEAISEELRGTGVTVTALCPGATHTGFQASAGMEGVKLFSSGVMTSEASARAGYLGMKSGRRVVIPGTRNKVLAVGAKITPRGISAKIALYLSRS